MTRKGAGVRKCGRVLLAAAVAAASACATPRTAADDVYRASAAATVYSLDCSQRAAAELGYRVVGYSGAPDGTLRAERRFDADGPRPTRGYITVTVERDPQAVMYVTAERIAEANRLPGAPTPMVGPTPPPTPVPSPGARRLGPRRVSPGQVAADARGLLSRCGRGSVAEQRT